MSFSLVKIIFGPSHLKKSNKYVLRIGLTSTMDVRYLVNKLTSISNIEKYYHTLSLGSSKYVYRKKATKVKYSLTKLIKAINVDWDRKAYKEYIDIYISKDQLSKALCNVVKLINDEKYYTPILCDKDQVCLCNWRVSDRNIDYDIIKIISKEKIN